MKLFGFKYHLKLHVPTKHNLIPFPNITLWQQTSRVLALLIQPQQQLVTPVVPLPFSDSPICAVVRRPPQI